MAGCMWHFTEQGKGKKKKHKLNKAEMVSGLPGLHLTGLQFAVSVGSRLLALTSQAIGKSSGGGTLCSAAAAAAAMSKDFYFFIFFLFFNHHGINATRRSFKRKARVTIEH